MSVAAIRREELIIEISPDIARAYSYAPFPQYPKKLDQITEFYDQKIESSVHIKCAEYCLTQLLKNSCKAFHLQGNKKNALSIKIVFCKKDGNLVIKFKDDASGFLGYEKGVIDDFQDSRIGLASVKGNVERSGGKMQFKNRKEGGASVYLSFPLPQEATESKES